MFTELILIYACIFHIVMKRPSETKCMTFRWSLQLLFKHVYASKSALAASTNLSVVKPYSSKITSPGAELP